MLFKGLCLPFIWGPLATALTDGGSSTITYAGTPYTVYEKLGLNGGTITAGTNVGANYDRHLNQYVVTSAGCSS
jgi:hypothetical protein